MALSEARAREHQRAMEAAYLLKAAEEAEHERLVHEVAGREELLRREDVLHAARCENASIAVAL